MNVKTTIPLAVAVVLGTVAAIVASQIVKQRPVAVRSDGSGTVMNLTDVVVASHDIAPGATLTSEDLKVLKIETPNAPANVASTPSALFTRVAKVQIPAGQMVHESLLAEKGVAGGLPGVIAPGYRAMTIEVNEFTGVAGLLEPGNRIDIVARIAEAEGGGQMSRTIVQNVPIIAVGPNLTSKSAQATGEPTPVAPVVADAPQQTKAIARSITVLVTPEDAEKIDLASSTNQARIVLRSSSDNETARVSGATLATLRGNASRAARDPALASAKKAASDAVFGSDSTNAFRKRGFHTVTVIRAGVASETDVEEAPKPADETTDAPTEFPTDSAEPTSAHPTTAPADTSARAE
jgi:pilus assembly protein CpaB